MTKQAVNDAQPRRRTRALRAVLDSAAGDGRLDPGPRRRSPGSPRGSNRPSTRTRCAESGWRTRRRGASDPWLRGRGPGPGSTGREGPIRFSRILIARCAPRRRFPASPGRPFPPHPAHHCGDSPARADRPHFEKCDGARRGPQWRRRPDGRTSHPHPPGTVVPARPAGLGPAVAQHSARTPSSDRAAARCEVVHSRPVGGGVDPAVQASRHQPLLGRLQPAVRSGREASGAGSGAHMRAVSYHAPARISRWRKTARTRTTMASALRDSTPYAAARSPSAWRACRARGSGRPGPFPGRKALDFAEGSALGVSGGGSAGPVSPAGADHDPLLAPLGEAATVQSPAQDTPGSEHDAREGRGGRRPQQPGLH